MKILHFLVGRCDPDRVSEAGHIAYHMATQQQRLGHEVAIFAIDSRPVIPIEGIQVANYRATPLLPVVPRRLKKDVLAWGPDVVHLHASSAPEAALLARWLHGQQIDYVKTTHSDLTPPLLRRYGFLQPLYHTLIQRPCMNRALFIHALGDPQMINQQGITAPVLVAPGGFDSNKLPAAPDAEAFRAQYPQLEGKQVFLFMGRLDTRQKGLDLMIKGFGEAKLGENAVLVIVGPGSRAQRRALEALAANSGVGDEVIFTGPLYRADRFAALAACDIFVYTARWEDDSLPLLEAAALGKPSLLKRGVEPDTVFARYHACISVDANITAMARGFAQFTAMPDASIREMGVRAAAMVKEEYDWLKTTRKVTEGYQSYGANNKQQRQSHLKHA